MKKIEGIILKSIDYKESSKIIYLFTCNGMQSIIVKGAKQMNSKFKGSIQSFTKVLCYTTDSSLPTLTDIDVLYDFKNIKTIYQKNAFAGLVVRVINQTKYDDERIYDLLDKTLQFMDNDNEEYYAYVFLLKNLYFLGITPNFSCSCGLNQKFLGFSISSGTMICEKCAIKYDVSMSLIVSINEIFLAKIENKIDINLKEFYDFLKRYYLYHASIEI